MELAGGQRVRDRDRELRVAADDVIALVRLAVDGEVPRLRVVAEQVDEIQRRLVDPG
jgi:hypothetical protein